MDPNFGHGGKWRVRIEYAIALFLIFWQCVYVGLWQVLTSVSKSDKID